MKEDDKLTIFYKDLIDNDAIDINDISQLIIRSYSLDEKFLFDEQKYYKNIKHIMNKLSKDNKKITLQIDVINRELFKDIINIKKIPNNIELQIRATFHPEYNINLLMSSGVYIYSVDEYIKEEEILNNLIRDIKNSNLTQFEKYLLIYNIVKNFKPYKENEEKLEDSRCLKHILNNDYMVCVGFSILLRALLNKVNIACIDIPTYFYQPIDDDNENLELVGHQRNLIKIDDDKYNIHGIYVSDPTFDHNFEKDLYDNSILTFNKRVEEDNLAGLKENDIFLLFQFKNEKEFLSKTNVEVLSKKWDLSHSQVHLRFIKNILNILIDLDPQQYEYFYKTYYNAIKNYDFFELWKKLGTIQDTKEELEDKIKQFYKEYCEYILNITTKNIEQKTIDEAIKNIKINN